MLVCSSCFTEPYYSPGECLECLDCNWFVDGETEEEAMLEARIQGSITPSRHLMSEWRKPEPRHDGLPEGLYF